MVNNKLGLKIVRVSQGLTDLLPINEDKSWSKILWDIREDLKNIQNLSASSSVLMLTNIETGHLLTVASPIGGRPGDFICAWIYVPASINIAGRELVELINAIKFELRGNKCDEAKLTELFSKSYEIAPAAKIVSKCSGNKNAYRYYGQGVAYTLSELLNDMCQSYYKDYKSIFLLDKTDGLVCSSCDDLSAKNVYSMIVVKSPGTIDSFVPYIAGEPFTGQKYAIEGDTIDIEWKKTGYRSIHTITSVTKDMQYSRPTPNQYVRVIPFGSIQVVDEISRPIREYQIYVANREVKPGNPFEISESTINNVPVEIIVDGYKLFSQNIDLTQAVRVKMVKETYSYEYMLPLKNEGDYCPIKISGKKKETGSPVKGYVLETKFSPNHPNYLRFEPLNRRFWIVCAVAALILLGAGFWIGYAVAGSEDTEIRDGRDREKYRFTDHWSHKYKFSTLFEKSSLSAIEEDFLEGMDQQYLELYKEAEAKTPAGEQRDASENKEALIGLISKIRSEWKRIDTKDNQLLDNIFVSLNTFNYSEFFEYYETLINILGEEDAKYDFIKNLKDVKTYIENNDEYRPAGRTQYDISSDEIASITFNSYKEKITRPIEGNTQNKKLPKNGPETQIVETTNELATPGEFK